MPGPPAGASIGVAAPWCFWVRTQDRGDKRDAMHVWSMLKDLVSHKRTWERTAYRTVARCLWTCSIFTRKVSIVNARIEVQLMKKWSPVPCRNAEISWNQIKRPLFASVCLAVVQPVFSSTSWVYGASSSHEPTACDHTQLFCYFRNWMK